jgi:cystathionine beta-lyase/cystathionine gamma-synthase
MSQAAPRLSTRILSPRRKTTEATTPAELAAEQLAHYHIDPAAPMGQALSRLAERLYEAHGDVEDLWEATLREVDRLDRRDRVAYFNAMKFLSFQLAKLLDTVQNPFRRTKQSLRYDCSTALAKGPYPVFDNVTAVFAANPVIVRTATYIFACAEWIEDAFQGREFLHEIYSRLLNPTSIALANHIVDIECGPLAAEYMAWNFNSGMAAVDAVLGHVVGHRDIVLHSRNVYGGTFQLLHDWYGKPSNLDVAIESFDGFGVEEFVAAFGRVQAKHERRIAEGRRIYLYLESPCNPHGYYLDVHGICRAAHERGVVVILDSTVATPFLSRPLQHPDPVSRPDYVVHSYTKDLCGSGNATAGCVIGRNEDMFMPKGERAGEKRWDETMFWNVYYVKGAFLDSDKAFEVLSGMRTLEMRMLKKCINTMVLARWLASHPRISVHCSAVATDPNHAIAQEQSFLGLPAPLFTIDFEKSGIERGVFQAFFDCLSPMFGHMVSLGQPNTVVLCPALTSHSELSEAALREAGISLTTVRIAVGDEDPRALMADFRESIRIAIDPAVPGFSGQFMPDAEADALVDEVYLDVHRRYAASQARMAERRK